MWLNVKKRRFTRCRELAFGWCGVYFDASYAEFVDYEIEDWCRRRESERVCENFCSMWKCVLKVVDLGLIFVVCGMYWFIVLENISACDIAVLLCEKLT